MDVFRVPGDDRMLHVLNEPSPAATVEPAIGSEIADRAAVEWELDRQAEAGSGPIRR